MLELFCTFALLAAVVAAAGTVLAMSADRIAEATGLGRMLVGSLLLAGATSLPELTVDLAAVRAGQADLAVGDLLGSSLVNLLILALVDLAIRSRGGMLSREAASHALSGTLSMALAAIVGMAILTAGRLPAATAFNIGGWSWAILAAYVLGARTIFIDQRISARAAAKTALPPRSPDSHPAGWMKVAAPAAAFVAAAAVLLVTGPRLAHAAADLADRTGLGGTFVGTTLVALTTSLPEAVASIAAVRIGAFDLVVGNVFGSNVFNMVLFLPLDAVHDGPLFAAVSPLHAVTALATILATAIAVLGQLYHVERRMRVIEPDAVLVLLVVLGSLWLVFRLS
jgi:cation:H+ antiporter